MTSPVPCFPGLARIIGLLSQPVRLVCAGVPLGASPVRLAGPSSGVLDARPGPDGAVRRPTTAIHSRCRRRWTGWSASTAGGRRSPSTRPWRGGTASSVPTSLRTPGRKAASMVTWWSGPTPPPGLPSSGCSPRICSGGSTRWSGRVRSATSPCWDHKPGRGRVGVAEFPVAGHGTPMDSAISRGREAVAVSGFTRGVCERLTAHRAP